MVSDGVVDVHTHYSAARARILRGGAVYREIDDRCWSAPRRLRDMDAEGVAAQVVSPVPVTLCHDQPAAGAAVLAAAQNDFLGMVLAGRGAKPAPSVRARELWCDSLTYGPESLALAVTRFGAGHVLLGTDYPFVAREAPPGAVLAGVDPDLAAAIRRTNALDILGDAA